MASDPAQIALGHIDQVLAERPAKNDHALSAATICLGQLRDEIVAKWRAQGIGPDERKRLAHVNSAITIVLGIHFPLGKVPWPELEKARDWLAEIVQGESVAS